MAQDSDQIADLDGKAARISRARRGAPLTEPSGAPSTEIVSAFLRARHGRDSATIESLVVEAEDSIAAGRTHVRLRQRVAGLEVYGTYVKATLTSSGALVSLVENVTPAGGQIAPAQIDYADALNTVLQRRYPRMAAPREIASREDTVTFARGAALYQDPTVTRVLIPMRGGQLRVGYLVETWDHDNNLWHSIIGGNGKVLFEELRTATDRYNVFVNQPNRTPQQIVDGPGAGNALSPLGWVTSDRTIGNNVDAYLDRNFDNLADSNSRPVSASQDFLTAADLTQGPTLTTNQAVGVTNLFYLNNVLHDKLYQHGFTEAAGNFQSNNFSRGGSGNDPVNAEAQDGGGINNANFATPLDGGRPRMQMYLWNTSSPNRDGDVDSDIVYHEYGHGLTWRMIGGMSGKLAGAIGEGMSDAVAMFMNGDDAVAEYSYNRANGIRRFRYTGYPNTYGDVLGQSVHNDGEIYAATMWKLRELWLASGRPMETLWDRVIGGMNNTPATPAFEDMRDGILVEMTDPAEECLVWTAFAQFGIGVGADGRVSPSFGVTESFAKPVECGGVENTAPVVTMTSPSDGLSVAQGTAVTFTATATDAQQGNMTASLVWNSNLQGSIGAGGSFNRSDLIVGTHLISATATDSGGLLGGASRTITITSAPSPPPSSGITLTTRGYKVKGLRRADLTWSGLSTIGVDIYRDGFLIMSMVNYGSWTDKIGGKAAGTFTYWVCSPGTTTCSNQSTVIF